MLLSAGLGTTVNIFQDFGISRSRISSLIELGPDVSQERVNFEQMDV
ncbi:MAG: hypothetical protein OXC67_02010 [Flavobacteriaceae bacterium]|nr:hypothetical protein [Flavobacteriaceae bacterium]MCY4299790.1 hypothetical protein [Flavobacteriaceae bacterium]